MSGKPFPRPENTWPDFKRANRRLHKRLNQHRRDRRRLMNPFTRLVEDRIVAEMDRWLLYGSRTGRPQGFTGPGIERLAADLKPTPQENP